MNHANAAQARNTLGALPYVIAAHCQGLNIPYSFVNETTASTDGTSIRFPNILVPTDPDNAEALEKYADYLFGFTYHESGHILYSDFAEVRRRQMTPVLHGFANVIEDVYIENRRIEDLPGTKPRLDHVNVHFITDGLYIASSEQDPPAAVMQNYCMLLANERFRDQEVLKPLRLQTEAIAEAIFPKGTLVRLRGLINQIPAVTCTKQSIDLAERIVSMLEEEAKQPSPPPQENSGEEGEQGDDSGGAGSGGPSDGKPKGKSKDQPSAGQGNATPSQGGKTDVQRQEALQEAVHNATPQQCAKDRGDLMAQAIAKEGQAQVAAGKAVAEAPGGADNTRCSSPKLGGTSIQPQVIANTSARTRSAIYTELETLTERQTAHAEEGDEIDNEKLAEAFFPHAKLFRERHDEMRVDTDVQIIVDVSGSMAGGRIETATQAAFAASEAVAMVEGAAISVGTFPGMSLVLDFDERPVVKAPNFALLTWGGTPMADGIKWAIERLLPRPARRKVILVMTDGQPENRQRTVAMIGLAASLGIECVGIGIQTNAVMGLFAHHGVVNDLNDLPRVLLQAVRRSMVESLHVA